MLKKISLGIQSLKKRFGVSLNEDEKNHTQHQKLDKQFLLAANGRRRPYFRQLLYIRKVLSSKELRIIQIATGFIVLSIAALLGNYYMEHYEEVPALGGEYIEALVGAPQFINPILAQNDADRDISRLVFAGLFSFDNFQLAPDLAENFTVSEDQKTYTLNLRKNVLWHDGESLTADDVIFSIRRIQDPSFPNPLSRAFVRVGVAKLDDFTVQFTLPEPFAPFLYSLTFGILPEHIWKNIPAETAYLSEYNLIPIGNGPFKFKSRTKGKTQGIIKMIRLERNEQYYKEPARLDAVSFKFFDTFAEAIEALKQKQVNGLSFLPGSYAQEMEIIDAVEYQKLNLAQYTALFFNQEKNSILKEKDIRIALSHAINRNQILRDALELSAQSVYGPIPEGFVKYAPETGKYTFDIDRANQILDEDGWNRENVDIYKEGRKKENGVAGDVLQEEFENLPKFVRKKKDIYLSLELVTVDNPTNREVLELISKDWKNIGVKTTLRFVEPSDILKNIIQPRAYEVFLYAQSIGADPDPYPFWHSSQNKYPGLALALFSSKETDKLLEEARATSDPTVRITKYKEFQNILALEVPAIFLYNPTYTYPITKKIKGFNVKQIALPSDRFSNITQWYIKTQRQKK